MKEIMMVEDICELLNVKESWVRQQIFNNTIPFMKFGRLIRFDREEINEWVNRSRVPVKQDEEEIEDALSEIENNN